MKYTDTLKDPRWQRKRMEIFQRDNWTCRNCMDAGTQLHVHHKDYLPGRMPWEYPDELMVTLCDHCHKRTHNRIRPDGFVENDDDPVLIGVEIGRFFKERFGVSING